LKKQYQIKQQRAVQQFRRIATERNPNIQMILPLAEIVGLLQQGVGNLLRETGLALMQAVMEEEVRHLAGERHEQHKDGVRIAGVRKTATAWWTDRRCRFGAPGCVRPSGANSVWVVTSCSSGADPCSWACGKR